MPITRILVADDSPEVRQAVCHLLVTVPDFEVLCEAADGSEALAKAQELQPDIVLLDIRMPNLSGIQAAQRILEVSPQSEIIFLTQYASRHLATEALRVGVRGYVLKMRAATDLIPAIRAVRAHDDFFDHIAS
jgi:DNA-binding NarL/FixJ family response regulator